MLPSTLKFIKSWQGIAIIITILMMLSGIFIIYRFIAKPTTEELGIEVGLAPIKIMQEKDGKEQEINFTETTLDILASAVNAADESFLESSKKGIEEANITKILFPIIPENHLNIKAPSNNPQLDIEKYLREVYTIFEDNNIQPNIAKLEAEALNQKTDNILPLIQTNNVLYKSLFFIDVPVEVLDLHLNYIRIAQVQNSFLLNLLYASQDPVKLQINSNITINLLRELDIPIKEKLTSLEKIYNITYQK